MQKLNITPSLKTLEPYKFEALIIEDLRYNGKCRMKEIQSRLKEIPTSDILKAVYRLANRGTIGKEGADKSRIYFVVQKKQIEK